MDQLVAITALGAVILGIFFVSTTGILALAFWAGGNRLAASIAAGFTALELGALIVVIQ